MSLMGAAAAWGIVGLVMAVLGGGLLLTLSKMAHFQKHRDSKMRR
jgi:hypothetical protein